MMYESQLQQILTRKGKMVFLLTLIVCACLLSADSVIAETPTGALKGQVLNSANQEPLLGVSILINDTEMGTSSNDSGSFTIKNIPVGTYNVNVRSIGFTPQTKTDVVIRPGRITFLTVDLKETTHEVGDIEVSADMFDQELLAPVSQQSFNAEEIRRSPGSAGDISRLLQALPSTAQVADNFNDLMVRGGSPAENGFYIDNIFVPNVNHFPVVGASGGPIGMLNTDFIQDIDFSAGGFSASYGDRLSSITEIQYRQGNTEETDVQLDLNIAGFGGIIEGPLGENKGSYYLSARRSYLDVITDAIGTGFVPRYGDVQGKVTWELSKNNRLEFMDLFGNNYIDADKETAVDEGAPNYGKMTAYQNTAGLTWRYLWGDKGYSLTSLSHNFLDGDWLFLDVNTDSIDINHTYQDNSFRLRNVNHWQPSKKTEIQFGTEIQYSNVDFNYHFGGGRDYLGNVKEPLKLIDKIDFYRPALFTSISYKLFEPVSVTTGIRAEYFSENERTDFSPRFDLSYRLSDKLTLAGAFGIYHQTLPAFILSQKEAHRDLPNLKAYHYIAGIHYMLQQDTRLSVEFYDKEYRNMPMDPDDPSNFVFDDGSSMTHFGRYEKLVPDGEAWARGVELLLQKKMAKNLYGLFSATYFQTEYKDLNGIWRNRRFDNQYLLTVIGGYKPNNKWEFSFRWNYAGGVPYTPFDLDASTQYNYGIIDQSRILSERYSDYHSLHVRFDRRFNFSNSSIVLYFAAWNLYNRDNVAYQYWNEVENKPDYEPQWSFIPIFGMEYEF